MAQRDVHSVRFVRTCKKALVAEAHPVEVATGRTAHVALVKFQGVWRCFIAVAAKTLASLEFRNDPPP